MGRERERKREWGYWFTFETAQKQLFFQCGNMQHGEFTRRFNDHPRSLRQIGLARHQQIPSTKHLTPWLERGKFKLDKFVNYCSRKGLSALYTARRSTRTHTCVRVCLHWSLKCAQLESTNVSTVLVQMCQHIKGWRLQSRIPSDYATFTHLSSVHIKIEQNAQ